MARRAILTFLALLLLIPAARADDAALKQRLDGVVDYAISSEKVVGTVVLVARNGTAIYRRAAGFADREARLPMREDTIFRLASMTKPIVSAAALALVDAGKLNLDDPVTRFLPEFRPRLADGREPTITIRHLLTHTAGLTYRFLEPEGGPYHRAGVSDGLDQAMLSVDDNLRRIASAPLLFEPGSDWGYSLATDVLGAAVARAGGTSLPDVIRQTITSKLAMADTGFAVADRARLAVPYADAEPRPQRMAEQQSLRMDTSEVVYSPRRILDSHAYPSGGAGMAGTAGDYLKFLEALRLGGGAILKPETTRAMTSAALGDMKMSLGAGVSFGLGVAITVDPRAANVPMGAGAWSWGGIYGTSFWVDPANGLSVVVLTNTAIVGMLAYPAAIRAAVYSGP